MLFTLNWLFFWWEIHLENSENGISTTRNFKFFWGACPQTPLVTRASGACLHSRLLFLIGLLLSKVVTALRSRKTVRFLEQIMPKDKYGSIFSRQMETIVYLSVTMNSTSLSLAMQKKVVVNEVRTPTNTWSGLGFSKSMPESAIKELVSRIRRMKSVSFNCARAVIFEHRIYKYLR